MAPRERSSHFLPDLAEPINRYFQQPIAARLVDLLMETRVTPNQVTYTSVLFGWLSAYAFSRGASASIALGGGLLEVALILDCVDGQLARAKGLSSDWGRLLDGIAGYVAYIAVVLGMMVGLREYHGSLAAIGALTILRAISYDYCKQNMTTMVQKGYDGSRKEILDTWRKIETRPSRILKTYFYYLQFQQLIFRGRRFFPGKFSGEREDTENLLTEDQRKNYYLKIKTLTAIWKWNGLDLPLFLLALFAILGILEACLTPMAYFMGAQYLLTLTLHHALIRHENLS
ncbi:MAG: CDP-alcohol phosphatidyltransferase family protein [Nitrospinales bacterium]